MGDRWIGFPAQVGERACFVTFNDGISKEVNALPFTNFVSFRVHFDAPDPDGFPPQGEKDRLWKLEQDLADSLHGERGVMVGRVTTDGHRSLHFYTELPLDACFELADEVSRTSGYEVLVAHEHEPDHRSYWDLLYPDDDSWQVIKDRRIQDALRHAGDPLFEPRDIDHRAYFASSNGRDAFVAEVAHLAECTSVGTNPDESLPYMIDLRHHGVPDHTIHRVTLGLSRAARTHQGEYEGWGTTVLQGRQDH